MKTQVIISPKIALSLIVILILLPYCASIDAQKSRPGGITPVMKISNLNLKSENQMKLERLNIDVKVIGQVAITTLDFTYYNSNSRVMEGEFNFPLGEGQTVSRFALDINGSLREGVVVEKEKGRKTFEAVVRRGVDPGLLEMTAGNNFRARVYPLPALGSRRIVIAFEQELTDKGNNDLFLLPLKLNEAVKQFSLHVEVVKNPVTFDTDHNEFNTLSFKKWNDSWVTDFSKENYTPDQQLALSFPHVGYSEKIYTAAKNNNTDSSYFLVTLRPEIIQREKALPKHIALLWDISNSSATRNVEREMDLLNSYFSKISNLEVDLVCFNIKATSPIKYMVSNGNWESLRSALKTQVYDGGTSLASVDFSKIKAEEILLFSDGLTNFDKSDFRIPTVPVIAINSSLSSDHDLLNYLSQGSGGIYINLTKQSNAETLKLLEMVNYHFISATVEEGKISNMFPNLPTQFSGSFSLAGIIEGGEAKLKLNFGFGNTIVYSKVITIYRSNFDDPILLRRVWAEKKLASLNYRSEKNKDEITSTGKEYGIITANTSLIVLESLNDYLQYSIVPPQEMQEEYFRFFIKNQDESVNKAKNHLQYVVSLSEEQSKWWKTNYPLQPDKNASGNLRKSVNGRISYVSPTVVDTAVLEEVISVSSDMISSSVDASANADMMLADRVSDLEIAGTDAIPPPPPSMMNSANNENSVEIQINSWDPQSPYLKVLQYSSKGQEYQTYLKLKAEYGTIPGFYIDASDFFSKQGKPDTAELILSNLAEVQLESPQLLRVLGEKLLAMNRAAEAVMIFEKLLKLKGEEAQSYRDLGLAYNAAGQPQKAIDIMYEAVCREWDGRFPQIEIIIMNEINNIISANKGLDLSSIDKRLLKNEPVDIRVVLTWDTDNCDMDLWVTDPAGEKCSYQNTRTRLGGMISRDFTNGYGPEEFMLKRGTGGNYTVQANYFGTRSQTILAPVNLHLEFFTNYGKPDQKKKEINIRLDNKNDVIDVGKFKF